MDLPRIQPGQVVYEDSFQRIFKVSADFGHFTKEYFVRDTGQRIGVIVFHEGSVLLVHQYRLIINGLSWEIPGGKVENGETLEAAAMRECLEEASVQCRTLKPLLYFQPGLDILHNPTYLFYTENWEKESTQSAKSQEVHGQAWVPLWRCNEMILSHDIVDAMSIVALLAFQMWIVRSR